MPDGPPLDVTICQGDVVRVVGPNGSGKTTLLRALAGLETPVQTMDVQSTKCGFTMQTAMDSLVGLTVAGEFRVRDIPCPAEMEPFHDRDVATLSSGEARSVSLHAAAHAPLLLLDEPVEGLDHAALARLHALVKEHRANGAVVVVDHGDDWTQEATQTIALGNNPTLPLPSFNSPDGPTLLTWESHALGPGVHALTGSNGCGKSTLLRRLAGQLSEPTACESLRMLPTQTVALMTTPSVRALLAGAQDHVTEQLVPTHLLDRHPLHLSGGETQRVALALVLGTPATAYLLDEPEAHLDTQGRRALHTVLQQRVSEGSCILMATHDTALQTASSTVLPWRQP